MTPTARERVAAALAAQPRERYLPADQRANAGYDGPLPIGHGQTNSQPRTVVAMLELIDARPGQRVLDVGAGSGWTTALLAELVGPAGTVVGVEQVPELVQLAAARLAGAGLRHASVRPATRGALGAPDDGPFDRVLISAMATRLPEPLVTQLVPAGVLVVPVSGRMLRVVRGSSSGTGADDDPHRKEPSLAVTEHGRYRFVPLVGG
ncbi:MAG: protein-L-isoaspartate O-methyltransferase family protein [Dermatophilaceae bacterium]